MTKVGITGHQRLDDPGSWGWVESTIAAELALLSPPLTALSSLAVGADQMFALMLLRLGGGVRAVIPFVDYERTFGSETIDTYRDLLSRSESVDVLPKQDTDEESYLAAGKRVVDQADVIVAVWNGFPAKGKGGTADIVAYAIGKGIPVIHINPVERTVTRK